VKKTTLRVLLAGWKPFADELPELEDPPIEAEDFF
jgi:hypothetical protein